jgi:hypothetical protein
MTKVEGEDQIAEEIKNNWFSKQYILLDDKLGNDFVRHRRNPVH